MPNSVSHRFTALDVFRGMTICFMIIVNTPGNGDTTFAPLKHAAWNGFTPTDLVFPSFMFVVGNAMAFAIKKWEKLMPGQVVGKILKRTALIFLLGYLMYWFPFLTKDAAGHLALAPLSQTRIFGVLQRIALAYGAAGFMIYFFKPRTVVLICIVILILYWPVMIYFGDGPDPLGPHTNAAIKFDRWFLGENHMYKGEGFPFEPESLLSTFPSIANVVAGYLVGRYVQKMGNTFEGLAKLFLAGFICFVIAYWWNLGFPINKKLWTSSFVLNTVGLDCMILGCIIYWVDFLGKTKGVYFFQVFGRNPLFIYLLSELMVTVLYIMPVAGMPLYRWLYENIFASGGAYIGSLLFALTYMLFCWSVGYILDKRKIYVRV